MKLEKVQDFLDLSVGAEIEKRNLFDLIQYSKVEGSDYWSGREYIIRNTPQQGINWIGKLPMIRAVIVKARKGMYEHDGWVGAGEITYHYSFKEKKGVVYFSDLANKVLINQPEFGYPIFLLNENNDKWKFSGKFSIVEISEKFVTLKKEDGLPTPDDPFLLHTEDYEEGGRKYAVHVMAERSKSAVDALKSTAVWDCDICRVNFGAVYGVPYIEAHHKIPLSTYSGRHDVSVDDFSLLCPNCHRAVHIYMKKHGLEYEAIRSLLQASR